MARQKANAIILLLGFVAPMAHAQTQGALTGQIADSSGAMMPGVTVVITNENTNVGRTVTTNDNGIYSVPALQPGLYSIRVEKGGFQSMVRAGIELQVQQVARVDFAMQIGQTSEVINVSSGAAMLVTESATTGTVIENRRIVELPLNGRNFLQLVALAPNVTFGFGVAGQQVSMQGGQRSQQTISVAGQRSEFNRFSLDGIENTDQNFNSYVFLPSVDALDEFKVQTGVYPAEFGRATSQINVSTKPGTNSYHGALFEFLRNAKLDARDFRFVTAEQPRNPYVRNQYGFTLGGPVWIPKVFNGRNRLFFMTNYEALRDRKGSFRVSDVPSQAMRLGNFVGVANASGVAQTIFDPTTRVRQGNTIVAQPFAGNVIPANRFNEKAVKLLELYPVPNVPATGQARNYQLQRVRQQDSDQFTVRGDFAENPNSNWFGRWSRGEDFEVQPSNFVGSGGTLLDTRVQQVMLSNTRVLRPTIVNEFRFGYNRFLNNNTQENAFVRNVIGEIGGLLGIATPEPVIYGAPSIGITGYSGFGDTSLAPNLTRNHTFQWIDNVSINKGRHSIRFGAEFRRDRVNQIGNQFPRGAFSFSGLATQNPAATANTGNGFADYLLGLNRDASGSLGSR